MENTTQTPVVETAAPEAAPQAAPQAAPAAEAAAPQTPPRQRNVLYGDLVIPIPEGATREDIREVMTRSYPELANATMMDMPGGDVRFVASAGEKGR